MADKWNFKPLCGSQRAIDAYPIKQGQFLIRKDGGAVYFDQDDETRILVANTEGGGGGSASYTYKQSAASDTWIINHNLGFNPSVTVLDSAGTTVIGEIEYNTVNKLTLKFSTAFSGTAYLS
jgi:hypothetical protein